MSLVSLESGIILLCHEPVVLSLEKKYHSLGKHREREREKIVQEQAGIQALSFT